MSEQDIPRGFADWYKGGSVAPGRELLDARWRAVAAAMKKGNDQPPQVLMLIESVFGLDSPVTKMTWFLDALKGADPSILLEDNENELTILAGCTVAALIESDPSWTDLAVVAQAATFRGKRRPRVLASLPRLASDAISKGRTEIRKRREKPDLVAPAAAGKALEDVVGALAEEVSADTVGTALRTLAQQGLRSATATFKSLELQLAEAFRRIEASREEIDMLWWVLGGWVAVIDAPLRDVPPAACGIVIGRHLADLTRSLPGPAAMGAIFERSFQQLGVAGETEFAVDDAIRALPPKLASAWLGNPGAALSGHESLIPLTSGIAQAFGDDAHSRRSFKSATGITNTRMSARDLAWQTYEERLASTRYGT